MPDLPRAPLRHRLPNPPVVFGGRATELDRLEAAVGRSPLIVLSGPGGIGKSSLVYELVARRFPERVRSTLLVQMRPGDPVTQLGLDIARALGVHGVKDWSAGLGDEDALLAAIIDEAEAHGGRWIVVEDLHHGPADAVDDWLACIAAYARSSRWIATTRRRPGRPGLQDHLLDVGPMGLPGLVELGARCAPELPSAVVQAAALAAGGSPWRLRQALASHEPDAVVTARSLVDSLPTEARALLEALAVLEQPLTWPALARVAAVPPAEELARLNERGVLVGDDANVRIHDEARVLVQEALTDADTARVTDHAASALADQGPLPALESLRLHLARDRVDAAAAILSAQTDAIVSAGHGPRLWRVLDAHEHPRLVRFRFQVAALLATGGALRWALDQPAPEDPQSRLWWAQLQTQGGRLHAALEVYRKLIDDAGSEAIVRDARFVAAETSLHLGRADDAITFLSGIREEEGPHAVRRDALLANVLAVQGQYTRAGRLAANVRRALGTLDARAREASGAMLSMALHQLGRTAEADVVFEVLSAEDEHFVSVERGRRVIVFRAATLVETGRFEEAEELLARLMNAARSNPPHYIAAVLWEARRRLYLGELPEVEPLLDDADRVATESRHFTMHAWSLVFREYVALLHGEALPASWRAPGPMPAAANPATICLRAYAWMRAVRGGKRPDEASAPWRTDLAGVVHARAAALTARAETLLHAGRSIEASTTALDAAELSSDHGNHLFELDARLLATEALLVAGRNEDTLDAVARMQELAARCGSERFAAEAELLGCLAAPDEHLDATVLERLAARPHVAAAAARRARALLGSSDGTLDGLDVLVLAAGQERRPGSARFVRRAASDADGWQPGWGLDRVARRIWLPDGRSVDLRRRPLMVRLLEHIAGCDGAASKEELARDVWGIETFHPLKDAARIQVTIHRLRKLIEDDPAAPRRLVTVGDAYALGDAEAFGLYG